MRSKQRISKARYPLPWNHFLPARSKPLSVHGDRSPTKIRLIWRLLISFVAVYFGMSRSVASHKMAAKETSRLPAKEKQLTYNFSVFIVPKLKCCGSLNYTDWMDSKWSDKNPTLEVPLSCCKDGENGTICNAKKGFDSSKINEKVMS